MNRLFEIILLLTEKEKMTAEELAVHFEVSRRTILRDLDKLLVAGVPVKSIQGYRGGITLDHSYQFPLDYMTKDEKALLLAGIKALDSIHKSNELYSLLQHFTPNEETPAIEIDLSSWYGTRLIPKIELIKQSIKENKKVSFNYYKEDRASFVEVSPYQITFKWSSWYLKAMKDEEHILKMYKLNRMDNLEITHTSRCSFDERLISLSKEEPSFFNQKNYYLKAWFDVSQKSKLIDEYGRDSFSEIKGRLQFEHWFTNKEYLLSWLLSFGEKVEVIEPSHIKKEIQARIRSMQMIYSEASQERPDF